MVSLLPPPPDKLSTGAIYNTDRKILHSSSVSKNVVKPVFHINFIRWSVVIISVVYYLSQTPDEQSTATMG